MNWGSISAACTLSLIYSSASVERLHGHLLNSFSVSNRVACTAGRQAPVWLGWEIVRALIQAKAPPKIARRIRILYAITCATAPQPAQI